MWKPSDTKIIAETNKQQCPVQFHTATPVYVQNNVKSFVDSLKLGNWRGIRNDFSTGMYRTSTKTSYFTDHSEESISSAEKVEHDYKICSFIYNHKVSSDFHKVIISATQKSRRKQPLIYAQYYFEGNEHEISCDDTRRGQKQHFRLQRH